MQLLKNSEGYIQLGPFIDASNNFLDTLDLTIYLSKEGSVFAERNATEPVVYDARGFYRVYLNSTDRDTLGILRVQAVDLTTTDELAFWENFDIVLSSILDQTDGSVLISHDSPFLNDIDYNSLSDSEKAQVDALIQVASTLIEKECNRVFLVNDYVEEKYNGDGLNKAFVKNIPLNSILAITISQYCADDLDFDDSVFNFNSNTGEVWFKRSIDITDPLDNLLGFFPEGRQNVLISYNGGFATVPAPIQMLCADLVKASFSPGDAFGIIDSEKLGQYFYKTKKDVMENILMANKRIISLYKIRKV